MFNRNETLNIQIYLEKHRKFKQNFFDIVKNQKDIFQIQYQGTNKLENHWSHDIFLRLFITAHSTIKLHKIGHLLDKHVMHTDTDSSTFIYSEENMKKLDDVKIYNGLSLIDNQWKISK